MTCLWGTTQNYWWFLELYISGSLCFSFRRRRSARSFYTKTHMYTARRYFSLRPIARFLAGVADKWTSMNISRRVPIMDKWGRRSMWVVVTRTPTLFKDRMTDTTENIIFPQLSWWAVITQITMCKWLISTIDKLLKIKDCIQLLKPQASALTHGWSSWT